jgi:hypothetical protein
MRAAVDIVLRAITVIDAGVFLAAAAMNAGARIALGPIDWSFGVPVWQAGVGEAVIGLALLAAAVRSRTRLYWIAYLLSIFGIAFGLLSARVVGAAHDIHVLLVPLAVVGVAVLIWRSLERAGAVAR